MPKRDASARLRAARSAIGALKARILAIDGVARGSLVRRTKVCGKPGCRCAADPAERHGPYFEWGHLAAGRRASAVVSPEFAARLAAAIESRRRLDRLLRQWEALTLRAIDAELDVNPGPASSSIQRKLRL